MKPALRKSKRVESSPAVKLTYFFISSIAIAVCAAIFIFKFVFIFASVNGDSMYPTLKDGNILGVFRICPTYSQKDIVALYADEQNSCLIKRIVAVENQTVDISDGIVYIDGQPLDEPYLSQPTYNNGDVEFPITVPKGYVFVMGDNRNNSKDSRYTDVGMIDTKKIIGKTVLVLWPLSDFKLY